MKKGAYYSFEIPDGIRWRDGQIRCGADGWQTEDLPFLKERVLKLVEDRRRYPAADWFESHRLGW